jgi:hypothetical protein
LRQTTLNLRVLDRGPLICTIAVCSTDPWHFNVVLCPVHIGGNIAATRKEAKYASNNNNNNNNTSNNNNSNNNTTNNKTKPKQKANMFDFLPVLLEDRKQRVLTVHKEAIELVEKYEQQICCISIAAYYVDRVFRL